MLLGLLAASLLAAGCSAATTADSSTTSATGPAAATTTSAPDTTSGPSGLGPGMEICKIADPGGGFYYLNVSSQTADDLSACTSGTPFVGGVDQLLNLPHMDRRCMLAMDSTAAGNDAIIGVYSDTAKADLDAAHAFCDANGGTNS